MDNSRMSNADMLQYCDEALAWEDFGPIDIYFFQSVKKILLGQSSPVEEPVFDNDLMGIERPVSDAELEPEYRFFADIYYSENGGDEVPDYSCDNETYAFNDSMFTGGFFTTGEANTTEEDFSGNMFYEEMPAPENIADEAAASIENADIPADSHNEDISGSFTVNI